MVHLKSELAWNFETIRCWFPALQAADSSIPIPQVDTEGHQELVLVAACRHHVCLTDVELPRRAGTMGLA